MGRYGNLGPNRETALQSMRPRMCGYTPVSPEVYPLPVGIEPGADETRDSVVCCDALER